jgi:hypothetical protein
VLADRQVPMSIGNMPHIMHNKFMVVDGRFVFGGTANWTDSDLAMNSNNFLLIDSPAVAADFTAEFEQMFNGLFGNNKVELDNGRVYQVGDTEVEVWFSPNEDAMGRILAATSTAPKRASASPSSPSRRTASAGIWSASSEEFKALDLAAGLSDTPLGGERLPRQTFGGRASSTSRSSTATASTTRSTACSARGSRCTSTATTTPMQPGDYQAGGGRLHSKTMLIDLNGDEPVVVTGSFNWSASATQSNDEYLLVLQVGRGSPSLYDRLLRPPLGHRPPPRLERGSATAR